MKKSSILLLVAFISIMPFVTTNAENDKKDPKDNTVVIYVTRHGKTILNTLIQAQGWADTPLTPPGIEVAEFLGIGLRGTPIKAAYSSDLGRARQTARVALAAKDEEKLEVIEHPGLREFCFGSYEAKPDAKMWGDVSLYLHYKSMEEMMGDFKNKPNLMADMVKALKELDTLGMAEDYPEVQARTQKAIKEIAEKEAADGGGNIILVTHGMAIQALLNDLDDSGKPLPTGVMLKNASVSKVVYKDGKFSVESYGDMSYVDKGREVSKK